MLIHYWNDVDRLLVTIGRCVSDLEARRPVDHGGVSSTSSLHAWGEADGSAFDSVSQIRKSRWTAGRMALVGDAAHAPALLSGQGGGVAMVGAHVLASEHSRDPARLGGAALIPRTRTMLWLRSRLLTALPRLGAAKRLLGGGIDRAARSYPLPDYARPTVGKPQLDRT